MKAWQYRFAVARKCGLLVTLGVVVLALVGCGKGTDQAPGSSGSAGAGLSGTVSLDGSSTVAPIAAALAEEFGKLEPKVHPTVAESGSGGGFKKFAAGEIDIANASRPIEPPEVEAAKKNGIEFVELPIAFDGLSVVVNPKNDFVDYLTVEELKRIWEPGSKVKTWADVRQGFPNEPIKLFGAGTDSGTFDYFTKAIVGKEKASRPDYQASEDDNTLVQGVSGDKYSLGYFGYSYFDANRDKLKVVKIDSGNGPVEPTADTIMDGTYAPLSRPLLMYANLKSLDRPEVMAFLKFVLTEGPKIMPQVGFVPLPQEAYELALKRLEAKTTGTVFHGAQPGMKPQDLLKAPGSGG